MVSSPSPTETASGVLIALFRTPGRRLAHLLLSSDDPEKSSLNVRFQAAGLSVTTEPHAVSPTPQLSKVKRQPTVNRRRVRVKFKQFSSRQSVVIIRGPGRHAT